MQKKHDLTITPRDRLMHAWVISMGLVRDFEGYVSETVEDEEAAKLFAQLALDECAHASRLLELLHKRDR